MAEYFEKLYSQKDQILYPEYRILIKAGALLRESNSGTLLIQMKLQNLSQKSIKSVKVSINELDTAGHSLESDNTYSYLDLNLQPGEIFGEQIAVPVVSGETRGFDVNVIQIVYSDGEVIEKKRSAKLLFPKQIRLEEHFKPTGFLGLYKEKTGARGDYVPLQTEEGWFCSCGMFNSDENECCIKCGKSKSQLFRYLDTDLLKKIKCDKDEETYQQAAKILDKPKGKPTIEEREKARRLLEQCHGYKDSDARIEKIDAEIRQEEDEIKKEKTKKLKRYGIITLIILTLVIAFGFPSLSTYYNEKKAIKALEKVEESYSSSDLREAVSLLEKLPLDRNLGQIPATAGETVHLLEVADKICGEYIDITEAGTIYKIEIMPGIKIIDDTHFKVTVHIFGYEFENRISRIGRRTYVEKVPEKSRFDQYEFTVSVVGNDRVVLRSDSKRIDETFTMSSPTAMVLTGDDGITYDRNS